MERHDIAIVGSGPAGISAALTATARGKKILLLGESSLSEKIRRAPVVRNYLGLPEISGAELQEKFLSHLEREGIRVTEDRAVAVYSMGGWFSIQGRAGTYESRSVVLATGVFSEKVFPGERENLGRGVSYCATCDAALYKDRDAVVVSYSAGEESDVLFLAGFARRVTFIPMYDSRLSGENIAVERNLVPKEISRSQDGRMLLSCGGASFESDGIFLLRDKISSETLVPGIATEENFVGVSRLMETNIPGCFACGDVTGRPFQYMKAAGEGNVAALSACAWLDKKN